MLCYLLGQHRQVRGQAGHCTFIPERGDEVIELLTRSLNLNVILYPHPVHATLPDLPKQDVQVHLAGPYIYSNPDIQLKG